MCLGRVSPFDCDRRLGAVTETASISSWVGRRKETTCEYFVAGATGAIGQRLVPLLIDSGHEVMGTTRTPSKVDGLRLAGATAVVLDGREGAAVRQAVLDAEPEVVVHQMTALSGDLDFRHFADSFAETNRLRTETTDQLDRGRGRSRSPDASSPRASPVGPASRAEDR